MFPDVGELKPEIVVVLLGRGSGRRLGRLGPKAVAHEALPIPRPWALAIAGQAVIIGGDPADTRRSFEHATTLSTASGFVGTVLRQFDLIVADQHAMPTVRQILVTS